jgi:hypothetical protein
VHGTACCARGGVLYGGGRERPRVRAGLACVSLCDVQYQTEATHESLLLRALRHLSQHLTPGHTKRDTCQTSLRPWAVPHANHCPPTPPGTRLPMRRSRSAVYAVLYPRASARDRTRRTHAPDAQAVHDNTAPLSALAVFARPPSHGIPHPSRASQGAETLHLAPLACPSVAKQATLHLLRHRSKHYVRDERRECHPLASERRRRIAGRAL